MKNERFIPIGGLFLPDNERKNKIKTIYLKEAEYADILGPIEYAIACFYKENRKLKDNDIKQAIRNIKINYAKDIEAFKEPIEKEIVLSASEALQDFKITHHEFVLALNYILWCIDNRKWVEYPKAYLDWLLDFFDMMDKDEKDRFHGKIEKQGKKLGISKKNINSIKSDIMDIVPSKEDEKFSMENSIYFSMPDDEKCNYLLNCKDEYESMEVLNELLHQIEDYMRNSKFEEAINIIDKIKDTNMERQLKEVIYSMKIECLTCLKDYNSAEKVISELIAINKDYPMAHFHKALIEYNKKNFKNALNLISECIQIAERVNMRHPQYYLIKSRILKELEDPDYKKFGKISEKLAKENMIMIKKLCKEKGMDVEEVIRNLK